MNAQDPRYDEYRIICAELERWDLNPECAKKWNRINGFSTWIDHD